MALSEKTKSDFNATDVNTTDDDMEALFEWKHGDKIYGTNAKSNRGMREYRRDINNAWGKQNNYKDIYVDTLLPYKLTRKRIKKGD